jgi:hypothetical protein
VDTSEVGVEACAEQIKAVVTSTEQPAALGRLAARFAAAGE